MRNVLNRRFMTAREARDQLPRHNDRRISVSTVNNRLKEARLRARRAARAPVLTYHHRQARLEYARRYVVWRQRQWNRVYFTDESRFCLYGNDGRGRVWRRRGERYLQDCFEPVYAFGGGSVMVWGGISMTGRTELVIIPPPGMNAQRYIHEVLTPHILPLRQQRGRSFVLMQDNARPHTARITQQFFQENNIELLKHPAMSPDLNPIEHVWDMVGRRLRKRRVQPSNLAELGTALQEIWWEIPQEMIRKCINMQKRCREVLTKRGGNTHY